MLTCSMENSNISQEIYLMMDGNGAEIRSKFEI